MTTMNVLEDAEGRRRGALEDIVAKIDRGLSIPVAEWSQHRGHPNLVCAPTHDEHGANFFWIVNMPHLNGYQLGYGRTCPGTTLVDVGDERHADLCELASCLFGG